MNSVGAASASPPTTAHTTTSSRGYQVPEKASFTMLGRTARLRLAAGPELVER
jgi:hypothetical protein